VSASTFLQVVAVQSGFTDSYIAGANYSIATSGLTINFSSGFASAANLISLVGMSRILSGKLQLTNPNIPTASLGDFVANAWYVSPVNIAATPAAHWVSTFVFDFTPSPNNSTVDAGFTFCIQNGPLASDFIYNNAVPVGGDNAQRWYGGGPYATANGSGFGYAGGTGSSFSQSTGIPRSVAVKFDASNNTVGLYYATKDNDFNAGGTGDVRTGGTTPTGISLTGSHSLQAQFTYDGTTLTLVLKDLTTLTTYTQSWTVNIPNIVGANTAYVGFTSASFYWPTQEIASWTMT
jgi:hypothetical protein